MIRRRSSQAKSDKAKSGKKNGQPKDPAAAAPFFNLEQDPAPTEEAPLFNLEELHERRILSWSPEPDDDFEPGDDSRTDEAPPAASKPAQPGSAQGTRSADDRNRLQDPRLTERRVESPPPPVARQAVVAAPAKVAEQGPKPSEVSRTAEPVSLQAGPGSTESGPAEAAASEEPPARRRGRPRGRPRRQVHFHVDPDEERLLMAAVEQYGSQQKGLIAALESLQEADLLRGEIERLRAESARYRVLLDEAESLFKR